jgi:F-type H+-transporting ATPase subunit b
MESTFVALGGLLLKALPTFFLVIVLHFYLKYVFFKPLKRVLDTRYEATEGARKLAARSLEKAAARAAEYEDALRAARAEIYQSQEQLHKRLEEERQAEMRRARERAEEAIARAKAELALEVDEARQTLERESDLLAGRIVESVLGRGVA